MTCARTITILLAILCASCTSLPPLPTIDYKAAIAEATPKEWTPGTTWKFTIHRLHGKSDALTFRVTDEPATTCSSGTWRKLELIGGKFQTGGDASYRAEGRMLVIQTSSWCDVGKDIRGELRGGKFVGSYPTFSQDWSYVAPVDGEKVD